MPLVSVITVFHEVNDYLRAAVRSVQAQTLRDFEHILVDNGTGMSLSALGESGTDRRIRVVRLPENAGNATGVRAGIEAARGEFIALLDSDDIALPRRLELQVAALRARPEIGFIGAVMENIDEAGDVLGRRFTLLEAEAHHVFLRYAPPVTTSSVTGWRALFASLQFRPVFAFAPDYDFFLRAGERTPSCALPEVLGQYRVHAAQMTQRQHTDQIMHGCIARICAARRRAGRAEDLQPAEDWDSAGADARSPAAVYAHFAKASLAEGFGDMAVYHARKLLSVSRSPSSLWLSATILCGALLQQPRETGFLVRLFFTGPLRTHGLKPVT